MTIIFSFLFSIVALASVDLELQFLDKDLHQGDIIDVPLVIRADTTGLEWSKLKGQTLGKTIYILDIDQVVKKSGEEGFTSSAKVIFAKVPETNFLKDSINGEEVTIRWSPVNVIPTEAPQGFLFGQFDVPSRPRILVWTLIILGTVFVSIASFFGFKKYKLKLKEKEKIRCLKTSLVSARQYDEVVEIWKEKSLYLETFPQIQEAFQDFESVLFKYQFKAQRSEEEILQVLDAYKKFNMKIEGVLIGI